MAHYYGRLQGGRGETTRLGTKNAGITSNLSTWDFHTITRLYWDELNQRDNLLVRVHTVAGGKGVVLYDGPLDDLFDSAKQREAFVRHAGAWLTDGDKYALP